MKICLTVPNSMHVAAMVQPWEHGLSGADITRAMRLADELGFYKLMMGEHFLIPREHLELSGDHYFHTAVALGVLAGHTSRIKLSSSVSLLPLQHPAVQAKAWSTLDFLSGGRATPMFGVGWLKEEFDTLGVDFHERGKMADEYIAAIIELWTKEEPSFAGKYVSFDGMAFAPKPVQKPYPEVWFGGDAKGMLGRVARFGDGWSPFRTPPEAFPASLDYIRTHPGYRGQKIEVFYTLQTLGIGAHHEILDDPRAPGGWEVQKLVDQFGWLAELGVTETMVPPAPISGLEAYLDRLRWIAEEVMPRVA